MVQELRGSVSAMALRASLRFTLQVVAMSGANATGRRPTQL